MKNRIIQEKIYLAKLLLGYENITKKELLKRFQTHREFNYTKNRRLTNSKKEDAKIKEWLEYPQTFVESEERVYKFLKKIDAII